MAVVIDDALLLTVLAGDPTAELVGAMQRDELFTTVSWYYRLGRAAHDRAFLGALSRAIEMLPTDRRARVTASLDALPDRSPNRVGHTHAAVPLDPGFAAGAGAAEPGVPGPTMNCDRAT